MSLRESSSGASSLTSLSPSSPLSPLSPHPPVLISKSRKASRKSGPLRPLVHLGIDYGTVESSTWVDIRYEDGDEGVAKSDAFKNYPGHFGAAVTTVQRWPKLGDVRVLRWGDTDVFDHPEESFEEEEALRCVKLTCHQSATAAGAHYRVKLEHQMKSMNLRREDVLAAWFKELFACIFEDLAEWPQIKNAGGLDEVQLTVGIAVPGDWRPEEQNLIRAAALQGRVKDNILSLTTESDALAVAYLSSNDGEFQNVVAENESLIFVDGGGGTTCFAASSVRCKSPLQLDQLLETESLDTGSELITANVSRLAEPKLKAIGLSDEEMIDALTHICERFEKKCKLVFGSVNQHTGTKFAAGLSFNFRQFSNKQIHFSYQDLQQCFDDLVDQNIAKLKDFINRVSKGPTGPVNHIIFAGGLHLNKYVKTRMETALKEAGADKAKSWWPQKSESQVAKGVALALAQKADIWRTRISGANRGFMCLEPWTEEVRQNLPRRYANFEIPTELEYTNDPNSRLMYRVVYWFATKGVANLTNELRSLDSVDLRCRDFQKVGDDWIVQESFVNTNEDIEGETKTVWTAEHASGNARGRLKRSDGQPAEIRRKPMEFDCKWRRGLGGVGKRWGRSVCGRKRLFYEIMAKGQNLSGHFLVRCYHQSIVTDGGKAIRHFNKEKIWDSNPVQEHFKELSGCDVSHVASALSEYTDPSMDLNTVKRGRDDRESAEEAESPEMSSLRGLAKSAQAWMTSKRRRLSETGESSKLPPQLPYRDALVPSNTSAPVLDPGIPPTQPSKNLELESNQSQGIPEELQPQKDSTTEQQKAPLDAPRAPRAFYDEECIGKQPEITGRRHRRYRGPIDSYRPARSSEPDLYDGEAYRDQLQRELDTRENASRSERRASRKGPLAVDGGKMYDDNDRSLAPPNLLKPSLDYLLPGSESRSRRLKTP